MFNVRPERYQKFEKALTTDLIYESSPESYNSSSDHPQKLDDEETAKNAYQFQLADIRSLRNLFRSSIIEQINTLESQRDQFTHERQFFLQQMEQDKRIIQGLRNDIDQFGQLMAEEKANTNDLIIRTQVSKICREALKKYEQDSFDIQYKFNNKSQSSIASQYKKNSGLVDGQLIQSLKDKK